MAITSLMLIELAEGIEKGGIGFNLGAVYGCNGALMGGKGNVDGNEGKGIKNDGKFSGFGVVFVILLFGSDFFDDSCADFFAIIGIGTGALVL